MTDRFNFLLMGKAGHGKSSTGDTLLKRRVFKTSSQTKEVNNSFALFKNNILMVVDGPGLEDTQLDKVRDKKKAVENMDTALAMCYGGIHAFLFNIKFGTRFTAEDQCALNSLKRIFGDDYMKFMIVVVTCGDHFQLAMKEEQMDITFEDLCKKQTGPFRQLYDDCKGRCVLFDNVTKDEHQRDSQIQHLVDLTRALTTYHGPFNAQCFQNAENKWNRMTVELKAPELTLEIQQGISLLTAEIDAYSKQPSEVHKEQLQKRIQNLKDEIGIQDRGYKALSHLMNTVKKVEENMNDVVELQRLATKLESIRRKKLRWGAFGVVCRFLGVGTLILASPVIAVAGAMAAGGVMAVASAIFVSGGISHCIGVLTTVISDLKFSSDEDNNQEKQNQIARRLKR